MRKILASALSVAIAACVVIPPAHAQGPARGPQPKVFILGLDGVEYAEWLNANTPNSALLDHVSSFAGGPSGRLQRTDSGPGWISLLTGVWADKHAVTSNSSGKANPQYPSLFSRLRVARPDARIASITTWGPINMRFLTDEMRNVDHAAQLSSDRAALDLAVADVRQGYDLVFLDLSNADNVGHSKCHGRPYTTALETLDAQMGRVMDEIKVRGSVGEDWMLLVSTDHGRNSTGCGHGGQSLAERTTFIWSNKKLARTEETPGQVSVFSTALRHLGIEPAHEWNIDGVPLNGP